MALVIVVATLLSAYGAMRLRSRLIAWAVAAASVVAAERAVRDAAPVVRMIVIATVLLCAMKGVVGAGETTLSVPRWLAFQTWLGMRPQVFAERSAGVPPAPI